MNNGSANFEATVVNFKTTGKKTVVQLELTNTAAARNYMFLVGALDKDVIVQLGDPQMSIGEFGVHAPISRSGLTIQTDASGIVQSAVKTDESHLDADDMFAEGKEKSEQDTEESDQTEQKAGQSGDDFELEFGGGSEVTQEQEEESEKTDGDGDGDPDPAAEVIGKDEIETFILSLKAPSYDDLPYDFASLLRQKRSGKTWMQIASEIGITSSKLSTDWTEYKKRLKGYLEGKEHGAA